MQGRIEADEELIHDGTPIAFEKLAAPFFVIHPQAFFVGFKTAVRIHVKRVVVKARLNELVFLGFVFFIFGPINGLCDEVLDAFLMRGPARVRRENHPPDAIDFRIVPHAPLNPDDLLPQEHRRFIAHEEIVIIGEIFFVVGWVLAMAEDNFRARLFEGRHGRLTRDFDGLRIPEGFADLRRLKGDVVEMRAPQFFKFAPHNDGPVVFPLRKQTPGDRFPSSRVAFRAASAPAPENI